jgi:GAF domain-containing protein
VPDDRLLRILEQLRAGEGRPDAARLCEVCADVVSMSGAGVMLMSNDAPRGSICSSNDVSTVIEDLQYTLGEGPCIDAYNTEQPVIEPNLADPEVSRWVAFSAPALEAGARAVFGFPMRVGAVRIGALNFYRDRPGELTDEQHSNALLLAEVAARAVLDMQSNASPGAYAAELEAGSDFRLVVHQASGMVSVQLGVSVAEALIRLRAYAFAQERPLTQVAEDIVARRLRLDEGA